jgi:hypothetical protein
MPTRRSISSDVYQHTREAEPDPADPIAVGTAPDGTLTYLVALPPEALPPVRGRDLAAAWDAARAAALGRIAGAARGFWFRRRDGSCSHLALADADARCWADAVDRTVGIGTRYGLSLCLRLLALVELLMRVPWAGGWVGFAPDGADLHPALVSAAATLPLSADARFDEVGFCARLRNLYGDAPPCSGASQ